MPEETLTLWVRLRGTDRERVMFMRERERRSYANLLRVALDHYYETHHSDKTPV